jgi:hypothetical protein
MNSFLPREEDLRNNGGRSWNEFSKNLSNYGVGMTEMPAETARMIGDLVTMAQSKMGSLSPEQAQEQFIINQQQAEQLKPMQHIAPEYNSWLANQENADTMRSLGNVAGGAIGGALFKEPIKSLGVSLKKQAYTPSIVQQLSNWLRRHPVAVGALLGGSRQAFGETVTEPNMEEAKDSIR